MSTLFSVHLSADQYAELEALRRYCRHETIEETFAQAIRVYDKQERADRKRAAEKPERDRKLTADLCLM
jgi:hypothetical protein